MLFWPRLHPDLPFGLHQTRHYGTLALAAPSTETLAGPQKPAMNFVEQLFFLLFLFTLSSSHHSPFLQHHKKVSLQSHVSSRHSTVNELLAAIGSTARLSRSCSFCFCGRDTKRYEENNTLPSSYQSSSTINSFALYLVCCSSSTLMLIAMLLLVSCYLLPQITKWAQLLTPPRPVPSR